MNPPRFFDGGTTIVHDWSDWPPDVANDCRIDCAHTSAMGDWRERLAPGFRAVVEDAKAAEARSAVVTRIVDDVQAGRLQADMHQMPEEPRKRVPLWVRAVWWGGLLFLAMFWVLVLRALVEVLT